MRHALCLAYVPDLPWHPSLKHGSVSEHLGNSPFHVSAAHTARLLRGPRQGSHVFATSITPLTMWMALIPVQITCRGPMLDVLDSTEYSTYIRRKDEIKISELGQWRSVALLLRGSICRSHDGPCRGHHFRGHECL